jgi:hypothetical protein
MHDTYPNVASGKAQRRSRKARGRGGRAPTPASSRRREERAARQAEVQRQSATAERMLGRVGERPASPLGMPVSEIAIFLGLVALVIGLIEGGQAATIVGAIVCALGVTEVTAREHFSGFRSHTTLLAAIPAVIVEAVVALVFGVPRNRGLLLLPVIPVFALSFWQLRRSFQSARHARVTRPPSP